MRTMETIRKDSGEVYSDDRLVSFLYILMRDFLPAGEVEGILLSHCKDSKSDFTNGWLANYAKNIAKYLKEE